MSRVEVNRYTCKLRLLQHNLPKEAHELDHVGLESTEQRTTDNDRDNNSDSDYHVLDQNEDDIIRRRLDFTNRAIKRANREEARTCDVNLKTGGIYEERRAVIKAFLAQITQRRKCGRCKG
jgi:DNA-directed RNA polymerase I subunit RPA1